MLKTIPEASPNPYPVGMNQNYREIPNTVPVRSIAPLQDTSSTRDTSPDSSQILTANFQLCCSQQFQSGAKYQGRQSTHPMSSFIERPIQ